MPAIPLTSDALKGVKRAIAHQYPQMQSAHVTEAIAYGLGFRTHAAMKPHVDRRHPAAPDYGYFDRYRFIRRAQELSGRHVDLYPLTNINIGPYGAKATSTRGSAGVDWRTASSNKRAWRNAMVMAINAGIEQRLFTILRGDNRWGSPVSDGRPEIGTCRFNAFGIPGIALVFDAGWDELAIQVVLWPNQATEHAVVGEDAELPAGDLAAFGYLERRKGAWLQVNDDAGTGLSFVAREHRVRAVADLEIHPAGFADSGLFIE